MHLGGIGGAARVGYCDTAMDAHAEATRAAVQPRARTFATLTGFAAVLMWSTLALLTALSGRMPPFQLASVTFAIGGALGTAAICVKQELLLVIIGGVFVMEAMSVMLQVGSFKLRKKRIFAMAPIHHHFELRGWHESQVIIRFWILSIMLALFGLALLKIV